MTKITRREIYAFCAGVSFIGALVGLLLGLPGMFLFNAVMCCYDVYVFLGEAV